MSKEDYKIFADMRRNLTRAEMAMNDPEDIAEAIQALNTVVYFINDLTNKLEAGL